jgi:hypothetical protein
MENQREKVEILDQNWTEITNRKDVILLKDNQICVLNHDSFDFLIGIVWSHSNHILEVFKMNPICIMQNDSIINILDEIYLLLNPDYDEFRRLLKISVDNEEHINVSQIRKPIIDNLDFKIINPLK